MARLSAAFATVTCAVIAIILAFVTVGRSGTDGQPKDPTPENENPTSLKAAQQREPETSIVDLAAPLKAAREAAARIHQAMQKTVAVEFHDAPWEVVAEKLANVTGINVVIDWVALEETGLANARITADYTNVKLDLALSRMLNPLGAAWVVEDEVLKISSVESVEEESQVVKVYDVRTLRKAGYDSVTLSETLFAATTALWEEVDGVGGTVSQLKGVLVVRQSPRVHGEISQVLDKLMAVATSAGKIIPATIPAIDPANIAVHRGLMQKIDCEYREVTLRDVAADIQEQSGIPIEFDVAALDEEEITADSIVSLRISGVSVNSALRLLLEPLDCRAVVDSGRLLITSDVVADEMLQTHIYDIADLTAAGFTDTELLDTILASGTGLWENEDGMGGDFKMSESGALIVKQTLQAHREIALLLSDLRTKHAARKRIVPPASPPSNPETVSTVVYADLSFPAEDLVEAIPQFVYPETWQDQPTGAIIRQVGTLLVVRQTGAVHQQIQDFLDKLEHVAAEARL